MSQKCSLPRHSEFSDSSVVSFYMTLFFRDFVFNSLLLFLLDAFLFLWACVHVCARAVKACMQVCAPPRGGQGPRSDIAPQKPDFLLLLTFYFALETRSCIETWGCSEAPGTYLALFFWCQGYKCVQPHLASYMGAESELRSSCSHGKYLLPESSPAPSLVFLRGKI